MLKLDRALSTVGWMEPDELKWLAEQAQGASCIFEIGSYLGKSTRALADNTKGIIHAIDSWNAPVSHSDGGGIAFMTNEETFNQFYMNLYGPIKAGKVLPICKNWEDYHPNCKSDFIFIDGNHHYKHVRHDIGKALHYGTKTISGHDWDWDGVRKAVLEYFPQGVQSIGRIWYVQDVSAIAYCTPRQIDELYQELTGKELRLQLA
jgi:hypothetical protein